MSVSTAYGQQECYHRREMAPLEQVIGWWWGCCWGHEELQHTCCHKVDTDSSPLQAGCTSGICFCSLLWYRIYWSWQFHPPGLQFRSWDATTCIVNLCSVLLSPCDCFSVWQRSSQKGVSQCDKSTQQDLDILTSNCALPGCGYNFFYVQLWWIFLIRKCFQNFTLRTASEKSFPSP